MDTRQNDDLAEVMERNINALLERQQREDDNKTRQEKVADAITKFTGSMVFVYIHIVLFGLWILVNLKIIPLVAPFDPSFVILAMFASVEAIFLSTFVLISQNRMTALADKRSNLDLHVSLLAEHEVTRLITLVSEIAKKMNIEEGHDPALKDLKKDVNPEKVLHVMEQSEKAAREK